MTTVIAAAASYNLTDLTTVKDELSLKAADTSNDSWLTRAIAQVSSAVARYTKRVFVPELVQDVFDIDQDAYPSQTPGGFAALPLSRWPVLAIVSVTQTLAAGTTQALTEGVDFRTDPELGRLLRLNPFTGVVVSWEAVPVTVIYMAGFGALVTESHAVPATPYKVTVSGVAAYACTQSVAYASGASLASVTANPAPGQYSVAAGVYTFNAADTSQTLTFAYATVKIPDDLVGNCLQLITSRFASKGRDPSLVQRDTPGVGTERWWFGNTPGQNGQFPPDIEAALDDYRVPTVA